MLPAAAFVLFAYLLGGVSPGYWLVRWRTGGDVRDLGSGGTGATNAGRVLGRAGFAVVLVFDAMKGALVVAMARSFGIATPWFELAAFAVVAGHVWPLQLRFRGGKGVAPLLGAWLVLAPLALGPCLLVAATALALLRRFTLAGLCGLAVLPAGAWWAGHGDRGLFALAVSMLFVILHTHRGHLRRGLPPEPGVP